MPAALWVGDYILVRVIDNMFLYMIQESGPIWTLIVSSFMQKDTDDDKTTSNDGGRIGNARDLDRSALQSAL